MYKAIVVYENIFISLSVVISMIILTIFFSTINIYATHPLITDDTETQGKGKIQIELNGEYSKDKENDITQKSSEIVTAFSYGLIDCVDIIIGLPYKYVCIEEGGTTIKNKGISDGSIAAKWRFYELDKFNFAIKPAMSFPTGDHGRGLGSGKTGYSGFLINTINLEPLVFHLNFGYVRNENKLEEEKNLWHVSAAFEYSLLKNLRIVADIGIERNSNPDGSDNPAFLIGGIIYSVKDNIDLDAGFKYGLNKPEVDYSFLAGITYRK